MSQQSRTKITAYILSLLALVLSLTANGEDNILYGEQTKYNCPVNQTFCFITISGVSFNTAGTYVTKINSNTYKVANYIVTVGASLGPTTVYDDLGASHESIGYSVSVSPNYNATTCIYQKGVNQVVSRSILFNNRPYSVLVDGTSLQLKALNDIFFGTLVHNNQIYKFYGDSVCHPSLAPNRAPTAYKVNKTAQEDTPSILQLRATDPDAGDTVTFSIVTGPDKGTAFISGENIFYTPPANWNGIVTLTYKATDSNGADSNIATITITVNPVNDIPSTADTNLTLDENTVGTVTLPVTDVDLQFEGDSHTWIIVDHPNASHGTASIAGNELTFTPANNWYGTTKLTYRVADSKGALSNIATLTITVNPLNALPVAQAKDLSTDEDIAIDVLLTATDVDSPSPTVFQIVSSPNVLIGTVTLADHTATFTPAKDWNGPTSFTYRAQDASTGAWSYPATVSIVVNPVNDRPSALGRIRIQTIENRPASVRGSVTP